MEYGPGVEGVLHRDPGVHFLKHKSGNWGVGRGTRGHSLGQSSLSAKAY